MILITIFIIVMFHGFVKANRELNLKELFIDQTTGALSHTKYWANIAYLTATVAFICLNIFNATAIAGSLEMLWLVYLGVVASNAAVSKLISHKYTGSSPTPDTFVNKGIGNQPGDSIIVKDDDYEGPSRRKKERAAINPEKEIKQAQIDNPDA